MNLSSFIALTLLHLSIGHSNDGQVIRMSMAKDASNRKYELVNDNGTPKRRQPSALIIGVKKGGTRALLQFIRMHPDVRAPGPEIHFFDKNFHRGRRWYR